MKINKKDYIDAINEIKVNEELKNKTIKNITNSKRKYYSIAKRIISLAAVFLLIFSFTYINRNNLNNKEQGRENDIATAKLENVGNYDNMKKIYDKNNKYTSFIYENAINSSNDIQKKETFVTVDEYSTTNIQVEGVDESDIVKTNGEYIFYCRTSKKDISVINVETNELITSIALGEEMPESIYLYDDRLIAIMEPEMGMCDSNDTYVNTIKVYDYDISNINDIKIAKQVEIEGDLVTSRMIGDYMYIVSNKYIYNSIIENENLLKPKYKDSDLGEEFKCVEYNEIECLPDGTENVYMIIASFNVKEDSPVNVQTYLGSGSKVYASTSNLYVANESNSYIKEFMTIEYEVNERNTKIHKLNLNNGKIEYVATATVPGNIKNQFSMDEYDENLRIATTYSSKVTGYKNVNNMYILDKNLNLIGQIENLAPEESIHSVRYMGKIAYMVTFEQIDPLFVIDLSDPTEPKVLGELKIPGYSEYLHPYDETHIIGFGKNTETDGENVTAKGFKMALFDVSDLKNPKELYSVEIGDSGTYSELLNNHKSLLFSRDRGIIAFPISIREKQNESNYYTKITFKGAIVYGVSLEEGFKEKVRISSSNVDFPINRIIYVGNNLYALSQKNIRVLDMNTMQEKADIKL